MDAGLAPAGSLMSLDVYANRLTFSIPHDQSAGRLILVSETWAKAVKQVGAWLNNVVDKGKEKGSFVSIIAGLVTLNNRGHVHVHAKSTLAWSGGQVVVYVFL